MDEYIRNQLERYLGDMYNSIRNKINDLSTQHNMNEICRIIDFMEMYPKFTIKMEKLTDDIDYYMRHKVSISSLSRPPITRSFILLDHNEIAPKRVQTPEPVESTESIEPTEPSNSNDMSIFDIPE